MLTSDSDAPWLQRTRPFFPDDVIREIVDIALAQNYTTSSTLALVCKTMYQWMIPIIFHSIQLSWEEDKQGLLKVITDETRDLGIFVHHLHLILPVLHDIYDTYDEFDGMQTLLLLALCRCTNLECLIFDRWDPDEYSDRLVSRLMAYPSPWDVRISNDNPVYALKLSNFPYLRNVTHFYCGYFTDFVCGLGMKYFALLPHVTHLGFAVDDIWGDSPRKIFRVNRIFETLQTWLGRPSLKMLYVEYLKWNKRFEDGFLDNGDWNRIIAINDDRLFIGKGLDTEFKYLMEDGAAVWDCVKEKFGNWRVTVKDIHHKHEESTDSDPDLDSDSDA